MAVPGWSFLSGTYYLSVRGTSTLLPDRSTQYVLSCVSKKSPSVTNTAVLTAIVDASLPLIDFVAAPMDGGKKGILWNIIPGTDTNSKCTLLGGKYNNMSLQGATYSGMNTDTGGGVYAITCKSGSHSVISRVDANSVNDMPMIFPFVSAGMTNQPTWHFYTAKTGSLLTLDFGDSSNIAFCKGFDDGVTTYPNNQYIGYQGSSEAKFTLKKSSTFAISCDDLAQNQFTDSIYVQVSGGLTAQSAKSAVSSTSNKTFVSKVLRKKNTGTMTKTLARPLNKGTNK